MNNILLFGQAVWSVCFDDLVSYQHDDDIGRECSVFVILVLMVLMKKEVR